MNKEDGEAQESLLIFLDSFTKLKIGRYKNKDHCKNVFNFVTNSTSVQIIVCNNSYLGLGYGSRKASPWTHDFTCP